MTMQTPIRESNILVVDDDPDVLLALGLLFKDRGYACVAVTDPARIPLLMKKHSFDAVLPDMDFSRQATDGKEGLYWLRRIAVQAPEVMVVPLTAYGDIDLAVKAVKAGAADFILKPWKNEKLLGTLSLVLALRRTRLELRRLASRRLQLDADMDRRCGELIGRSPALQKVMKLVGKVTATDANVLILGGERHGQGTRGPGPPPPVAPA
jgi:two-component system, NtrC family, response regulator HydG